MADLSLDKQMLQDVLRKSPEAVQMRGHAGYLQAAYGVSERRSCQVLTFDE